MQRSSGTLSDPAEGLQEIRREAFHPPMKNTNRTAAYEFPMTQWELVEHAKGSSEEKRQEALEILCRSYWLPLYSFVRRKGHSPADAEDATQGFLSSFLKREDFGRLDAADGKMRTYLLSAITNFLNSEYRARRRQKRGGDVESLSIQDMEAEGRYGELPLDDETPESIFDRAWAFELLDRVLGRVKDFFEAKGKGTEFGALAPFLKTGGDEPSHEEVATQLGCETNAVKTMVFRMRRRYRDVLHEVVKETLVDGANVDDEIQTIAAILGR